jgi:hypothetical protein
MDEMADRYGCKVEDGKRERRRAYERKERGGKGKGKKAWHLSREAQG